MQKKLILFVFALHPLFCAFSQTAAPMYFKGAIRETKLALQRNIIQNTITKNLSLPLNYDTEENWTDAFWGMQVLHYRSPWADAKIFSAFDSIDRRSTFFQRALLELVFTSYGDLFIKPVTTLMNKVNDAKVYAMCAEYLMHNNKRIVLQNPDEKKRKLVKNEKDAAITHQLFYRMRHLAEQNDPACIAMIMRPGFLQNFRVLYSFQRKNRNFPGIALIRDSTGQFLADETGVIFSVPQLARSISNMPGYLTNGNTPQGIFRMYGFDTSKSSFIGPTTNIQLTMPWETSLKHFFNDSTITDSTWSEKWFKKLLPGKLENCNALYESFYAGKAGRTEIIAHGTTVDPDYYKGELYYPQTPTMGCLCTKEIWSEEDGKRLESDQEKLVAALQRSGGANGYCVVIELNDEQRPVTLQDILPWIKHNASETRY